MAPFFHREEGEGEGVGWGRRGGRGKGLEGGLAFSGSSEDTCDSVGSEGESQ